MNIRLFNLLCLFNLCVICSAVSSKETAMDVNAIQKLTEKLNLLEQRLAREHSHLHNMKDKSLSNENSNIVNERWIRKMENRIETLENTILEKNCDKKFHLLEETVIELSKQVKQLALYNERTERLDIIVRDQEKTIVQLRQEVMKIKQPRSVIQDFLVPTVGEHDKNGNTKDDINNKSGITQRIRSTAASSGLRDIVSNKKRLIFPATQQPVTTPTVIAFYAYMGGDTPSITIQYPLVFDVVKTNNGNGYHPSTGTFIAPETGIYVFTWTTREIENCRHSTQLMVNTSEIGIIHVDVDPGVDLAGTGVVVTHVNAGDDVYVRTHENWNNCNIISNGAGRSSFAGWKLS